jgi:hypothetical protein
MLFFASLQFISVYGWSNGGWSSDISHPDYGTHDWIAEHALAWLPVGKKQFIIDNMAHYLYGTELPDSGPTQDYVKDIGKHHVYFFANGSLQDDASAARAQQEYENATSFFRSGDVANAAKSLGMMAHYLSDVAVFAHVMGSDTSWGSVYYMTHSDYEDYVRTKTDNYGKDYFHLSFDGSFDNITVYSATLKLACNTTFGVDNQCNCTWMDQNCSLGNATYDNRTEQLLNLAVNLLADVLNKFYDETAVPEFLSVAVLPLFMVVTLMATAIDEEHARHRKRSSAR